MHILCLAVRAVIRLPMPLILNISSLGLGTNRFPYRPLSVTLFMFSFVFQSSYSSGAQKRFLQATILAKHKPFIDSLICLRVHYCYNGGHANQAKVRLSRC